MRIILIMLLSVSMLSACSTSNPVRQAQISSDLLQPCKEVVVLSDGSRASVMRNITVNAFNQQECIDRQGKLVEAVKATPK